MPIYINETLKRENLISAFCAVADDGCETRAEIAAASGVSIVTAGRAAEAFLNCGVFIQKKSQKKSVGRRAGRICYDESKCFVIIDITSHSFCTVHFDLALNRVYRTSYEYIDEFCYAENLCIFLHRIKASLLRRTDRRYLAICMTVPGSYVRADDRVTGSGDEGLEALKLREYIRNIVGMPVDIITDNISAASRYCQKFCRQEENILYINADRSIAARLIVNGKFLRNTGAVRRGMCGKSIESTDVAAFIADVCSVSGVRRVYIESHLPSLCGDLPGRLNELLSQGMIEVGNIPEIVINTETEYSQLGAATIVRRYWLEKIIR